MERIDAEVKNAKKIAIAGHIRPDGDCIGSCMALYGYLKNRQEYFGMDQIDVYLEPIGNQFRILTGVEKIKHNFDTDEVYDVFISLDCGSLDRLGNSEKFFRSAKKTMNIDHHISNIGFAKVNHVVADASSTCEVLYELLDEAYITKEIAEALYVGMIHDTAVFKHSNTKEKTMKIAGKLLSKGIEFSRLIDESFYQKTYMQNQILGRCLMDSILVLDGTCIVSSVTRQTMDLYQAKGSDLEGVIDQLRVTKGVEVALFLYETGSEEFKVSMRSNGDVNVSKIAVHFGGGGHLKAAGCTMRGTVDEIVKQVTSQIAEQQKEIAKSN